MSSGKGGEDRRHEFKFQGLTSDELRRRREETTIELRRSKREDSLNKRRTILDEMDPPLIPGFYGLSPSTNSLLKTVSDGQTFIKWYEYLKCDDANLIAEACQQFRKVLSRERNPPIAAVMEVDIVPLLVGLLDSNMIPPGTPQDLADKIVFEAAWVLTNIASGESRYTTYIVKAGAVYVLLDLLSSPNTDIREQSVWALGNIAGDCAELRDCLLEEYNVMMNLLKLIYDEANKPSPSLPLLRNAVWTLSNLCRGKPAPKWSQVGVALPVIAHLLGSSDVEILSDTCWALSYLTDGASEHLTEIINSGCVAKLVELLGHRNLCVQTPALRAVGNVVTGNDDQTQYVINLGALKHLKVLLDSNKAPIQKEACWAISNITAGTVAQIQAVIDAGIFPLLIVLLKRGDAKTKREACWAVCNSTSCFDTSPGIVKFVVDENCIGPLCNMLDERGDSKLLQVVLDGLENILIVGENEAMISETGRNFNALSVEGWDGIQKLVGLQTHYDTYVYLKAKGIIDRFFSEDTENPARATEEQQMIFDF